MKPHIFHPEAGEEYAQAVEYYTAVSPELGRFYDEIERLIPLKFASNPTGSFASAHLPGARCLASSHIRWFIRTKPNTCGSWR